MNENLSTFRQLLGAGVLTLAMAACTPTIDTRGNLPDADSVARLHVGSQSREEVAELLGTPSSVATFEQQSTWYYISKKTETTAFLEPKLLDQQVLVVEFDKSGMVRDVKRLGMSDGAQVKPVDRETPSAGNKMGLLEQLFGNVGRFNKDKAGGGR